MVGVCFEGAISSVAMVLSKKNRSTCKVKRTHSIICIALNPHRNVEGLDAMRERADGDEV